MNIVSESQKEAAIPEIKITCPVLFRGKSANPGNVFFIATWQRWENTEKGRSLQQYEEAYQVARINIQTYGREMCEQSVIQQVIARHFKQVVN